MTNVELKPPKWEKTILPQIEGRQEAVDKTVEIVVDCATQLVTVSIK